MLIGHVVRPHGIRGAVRVRATGVTLATVDVGESLSVADRSLRLVHRGGTDLRPILRFEGVDDRDAAAELSGAPMRVLVDRLPPLEEDAWYVRDLVGCAALCDGRRLGDVREIEENPANDLVVVATESGDLLVPLVREAVLAVDTVAREIEIAPEFAREGEG